MQIKAVKPINFLFFRTEASVAELVNYLPVGQELFKEAVAYNLPITGPVHWHYFGFEGDLTKPFTLEIALPVGEVPEAYDGKFHFKRTDSFKCVSAIHEGSWLDMPQSYGKLMQFIEANHLTPLASNREIYVNADFKHPEANVTEIQIGIN
ncbi:GyrI-like domain-containing protein [Fulvivirgaceae bacterium PWU4]|uniref:GyrI-like domain-containing protein n=1 Tax=Chryseosolibacter histidini TaxID=2782349 RepID=A0AAP2DPN1_9BACT|nr:GyrI-like domain-containing protein [Chryseosolibacter histidini]MBT1697994.1 GyrI-like domain-containing protein [Chryseosolibacter histidini]